MFLSTIYLKWIGAPVKKAAADKYESISYNENTAPVSINGVAASS